MDERGSVWADSVLSSHGGTCLMSHFSGSKDDSADACKTGTSVSCQCMRSYRLTENAVWTSERTIFCLVKLPAGVDTRNLQRGQNRRVEGPRVLPLLKTDRPKHSRQTNLKEETSKARLRLSLFSVCLC
ncbi:hypothetical protein TGDOM2_398690 [Toxoplasma gondii GAB2-2007-GAL-DOM2]|uniref:Uncharacterized protein n=1 Tax=Toxoplasma gondii GAB2-2007-GAL-DOM2 TaxID=1130820 RepID=A0A086KG04_TOXGO|nr:hypothetical protein TGDOM2_398690 [Toxoplasma gondii GAB2-2007-GAL-DOM2]